MNYFKTRQKINTLLRGHFYIYSIEKNRLAYPSLEIHYAGKISDVKKAASMRQLHVFKYQYSGRY
ncbi:hypothetical protein OK18_09830 [Chryseobacterium gallinarum]|uniref:Uncharacterized protein n=1 Tax=Chryseobacterium gallinarum TaxID=1324352 RepID=A0A0G3M4B7_CHRGL|nr:hypothetical protein OK18_09830 [Chryseobacterium gallinarum]